LSASLFQQIADCLIRDQRWLRGRLRAAERAAGEGRPSNLAAVAAEIEKSIALRRQRQANLPRPTYPLDLPVVQKRHEIAQAIAANQTIVLCGQTGSGKTTQLPKICLELGRGAGGMIGHTQPRRIAARTVAARIAQELETGVGQAVGYKIRFRDRTSADTCIKLMTDGILLAETQGDRLLEQYDTIIIDEAHERSLNIDFLLGYLRQLLPRRPDLKLIITSATIDPQRFSRHFGDAPIIEVSGRTYPVEVRYRPLAAEDEDEQEIEETQAILDAVDEVAREGPGDVLVFLPGEREIREAAEALRKHHPAGTEILPLYSRLSAEEQNRVFQPHGRRRIVLATNVAETSLTVPGIRCVVDTGLARISRYSPRTKVQRLPIEPISQASADQRAGRCGRLGPGVCIRLYGQDDFATRPAFTEPEILRTNLASVILQMAYLKLGAVQEFPFIEPPEPRSIRDGYQTLHEIGAIDERNELTDLGRQLARLPTDPRIGRMVLQARQENAMAEVLVIAAALSIQDPRERPLEKQKEADQAHAAFRDENSDFLSFLKLWEWYHQQARHLSTSKLRKACQASFLSFVRMREWHDIHQQLHALVTEMALVSRDQAVTDGPSAPRKIDQNTADAIHRSLLAGLLSNIGTRGEKFEYTGARGTHFRIFPGSGLFDARPAWVMAAELVETTRLYARTVARIRPEWIERLADHLTKHTYSEPHWNRQTAHVTAYERVTLYGLVLVPRRTIHYGPIDPKLSRELFIRSALVQGDYDTAAPYFRENQRLIDEITALEAKRRSRDVLVDEQVRYDFYDARIPAGIHNGPAFEKWRRQAERDAPRLLHMSRHELMQHAALDATAEMYPDAMSVNGLTIPLEYHLEPGSPADGVTAVIPLAALNQVSAERFEWIVPGLLMEKITALIKSLPKPIRVQFVPAPEFAQAAFDKLKPGDGSLCQGLALHLSRVKGIALRAGDFDPSSLLDHLHMNYRVVDDAGKPLAAGRDLAALRKQFGIQAKQTFEQAQGASPWTRSGITSWDFGDLPESVEIRRHGLTLRGHPALVDDGASVSMRLFDSPQAASQAHRGGVRRLFLLQLGKEMAYLERNLPNIDRICLCFAPIGSGERIRADLLSAVADRALGDAAQARTQQAFIDLAGAAWQRLSAARDEVCQAVDQTLTEHNAISRLLSPERIPPLWEPAAVEIREQLAWLVPADLVTRTPPQWLVHLPRFIRAAGLRLGKLGDAGHIRDNQRAATVRPHWQRYVERRQKHARDGVVDPNLELFRWMIEELRVSVFAQELKTSFPISEKRLAAQWELVKP
jgi:ATP-dependent helicase HrpA